MNCNFKEVTFLKKFRISVNGTIYEVGVEEIDGMQTNVETNSIRPQSTMPASRPPNSGGELKTASSTATSAPTGTITINAPMPGNIVSVNVNVGDIVNEGDVLCILEAMKMENEIAAPAGGKVTSVNVSSGSAVNNGDLLLSIG